MKNIDEKLDGKTSGQKIKENYIKNLDRYKSWGKIVKGILVGTLIFDAVALYHFAIQEHGSLSKAYDSYMQQAEKLPAKMFYPSF